MRSHGAGVAPSFFERQAGPHQQGEQRLTQELGAQEAIKALNESVLHRLAGIDGVPRDPREGPWYALAGWSRLVPPDRIHASGHHAPHASGRR